MKSTARICYRLKESDHPKRMKEGIAKGQSRRRLKMEVEIGGKSGSCGKARKLCKVMRETRKVKDGKELLLRGRKLGAVNGMWCKKVR